MTNSLWTYWHFDITYAAVALILAAAYLLLSGGRIQKGRGTFFAGLLLMLLLGSSPLHFLGMHYLFSAHMVIHVCLLLLCAPLLVLGLPPQIIYRRRRYLYKISVFIYHRPWLCWLAGICVMWFWHIPVIFDAAFPEMHSAFSGTAFLHTFSLVWAGILFFWPLIGPFPAQRISPPLGVVYLFTACICCSLLGLLLTFSPLGTYHHYLGMGGDAMVTNMVRNQWQISAQTDQQAAGLIMWVPCCFIYLAGCIYLMGKWFTEKDGRDSNVIIKPFKQ